jgi:hypothetical protein
LRHFHEHVSSFMKTCSLDFRKRAIAYINEGASKA